MHRHTLKLQSTLCTLQSGLLCAQSFGDAWSPLAQRDANTALEQAQSRTIKHRETTT